MIRQIFIPTRLLLVIVTLTLSLGSLAACSPAPSAPPPGTYTTTLVEADLPPEFPEDVRGFMLGMWELTLSNDNSFQVSKDGNVMVEGNYTSTQDQIVFTDEKGPAAEPDAGPGTYKWSIDGQILTMVLIDDNSIGRSLVAASHPLTKQ